MATQRKVDVSVLNTPSIADITVTNAKGVITGVSDDPRLLEIVNFTRTVYAAGTISRKTYDFSSIVVVDQAAHRVTITHNGEERPYVVFVDDSSADDVIVAALLAAIERDPDAVVEDDSTATDSLKLKLKSEAALLEGGDFSVVSSDGAVEAIVQAFIAPAGTASIVEQVKGNSTDVVATGQYTTYEIVHRLPSRHNDVSGNFVDAEVIAFVYAEETATDYDEFDAQISKVFTLDALDNLLDSNGSGAVTQTLTGAGAVDLTSPMTLIVTTGADALTLADGQEGQEKFIVMKTDANDGTLTPDNLKNGSTLTFDDVGDSAFLKFMDGDWVFMGGTATLA